METQTMTAENRTAKVWNCGHTEDEHSFADVMFCNSDPNWFEEYQAEMGVEKNRFADFKQRYIEAKTWADAKALAKELSQEEKVELNSAMEIVGRWTGLDMRQDFFQGLLAHEIIGSQK